ncbi:hypothetical protein ASD11_13035 [Aeromicrobium sp. Root495]|uniref:LytR C-terminal domain-containing protein n=1 Tax=Aeromicrobium sp. Root495 TaxID=1736550 RepID=UPI0006FFAD90|nr:LytR C-terminal domain-containing protein [Aeromicrobium sp. Root495]KQY60368.1 hypothetical protein ASD11_13035 [Aeromicrobium sp. Root495]
MVAHRKTPSKRAYVLPGWFFVLSAAVMVAAAGWLAWVALNAPGETQTDGPDPSAASPSASASPSRSPEKSATPSPSPTAEKTTAPPSPSPSPSAQRTTVGVSVLNGSRTPGLARSAGARVQQLGWTVGTVGNWRAGGVAQTSVFYPAGREAEARLLADDLGVGSVAPALAGMSTERLTLVLLGPVA